MHDDADVIVVGAGAAGAVLAARLSEDSSRRVLLLEAGGRGRGPLFSMPLMSGVLLRSRIANWGYVTEPEPHLNNRRITWPRGRALGGSTAINGMVYARGLPIDFDSWAQRGLPGWSYSDVLPLFRRSERHAGGASDYHGGDGPMAVEPARWSHKLSDVWLEAARQAGHTPTADFNGPQPEGIGRLDFMIDKGRRASTARAFLDAAASRPNLKIRTGAQIARVLIEGAAARGVVLLDGTMLRANEVVLCGGVVNSPQVLMLSGIGPADQLALHGITAVADLPGVGANLHDHLLVRVGHASTQDITLDRLRRVDRAALVALRAFLFGTGPGATFPLLAGGQFRSDSSLDTPDLKASFLPGWTSAALRVPFIGMQVPEVATPGFFANIFQMRPESRGRMELASADPRAHPRLMPNYLASATDRIVMRRATRMLREIFRQRAFDPYRGIELAPGPDVTDDDAALDAWIARAADTVYHPVGTCRMGPEHDPMAVVDAQLRVRGVAGLRVADASVMPDITSCNTAAPTIMIGEKCAEMMRAA
jgi:choline dehydrogenase